MISDFKMTDRLKYIYFILKLNFILLLIFIIINSEQL